MAMPPSNLHVEVPHVDASAGRPRGPGRSLRPAAAPAARRSWRGSAARGSACEAARRRALQFRLQGGDLRQQRRPTRQPPAIQAAGQTRQLRPVAAGNVAHGPLAGVFGRSVMSTARSDALSLPRVDGADDRFPHRTAPVGSELSNGLGIRSSAAVLVSVRATATVLNVGAATRALGCVGTRVRRSLRGRSAIVETPARRRIRTAETPGRPVVGGAGLCGGRIAR